MIQGFEIRKVSVEKMSQLIDEFDEIIIPWTKEKDIKTITEAFEVSYIHDKNKFRILDEMYHTEMGLCLLSEYFDFEI